MYVIYHDRKDLYLFENNNSLIFFGLILIKLLCFLQLLGALDGVGLVFVPPQSHLSVGLGQTALQLGFGLLLLLKLLTNEVTVVPGRL